MKKVIVLLFFNCLLINAFSQANRILFTSEQEFILKATDSVLYIIRQDYVLRDTISINPNEYGRGGREYFGRIYTLGIVSEGKLWCDAKVNNPWLFDPNYNQFQHLDTIRPVLSKIAIRQINSRNFVNLDLQIITKQTEYDSLLNKLVITNYIPKNQMKSIANIKETKDSTGWLLLAYTNDEISKNDSCNINIAIYKSQPRFKQNSCEAEIKQPIVTQNLLGGFYFNTNISIGKIDVIFSGILNKRPVNCYISTIPKIKPIEKKEDHSLTPINMQTKNIGQQNRKKESKKNMK